MPIDNDLNIVKSSLITYISVVFLPNSIYGEKMRTGKQIKQGHEQIFSDSNSMELFKKTEALEISFWLTLIFLS